MGLVSTREVVPACTDNRSVPAYHSSRLGIWGITTNIFVHSNKNIFEEIFMVLSAGALFNPSNVLGRKGDCTCPLASNLLKKPTLSG